MGLCLHVCGAELEVHRSEQICTCRDKSEHSLCLLQIWFRSFLLVLKWNSRLSQWLPVLVPVCIGGSWQQNVGNINEREIKVRKVKESMKKKEQKKIKRNGSKKILSFQVLLTNYIIWSIHILSLNAEAVWILFLAKKRKKKWNKSVPLAQNQMLNGSQRHLGAPAAFSCLCPLLLRSSAASIQKMESKDGYQRDSLANIFQSNFNLM